MKKQEFAGYVADKLLLLDGATGSNLQKAGMPADVCVEEWSCENPEALKALQKDYVEAGSQIVYACTFSANRIKLKEYGLEDGVSRINTKAVEVSKAAVGSDALVAGDVTMTGQQLEPLGTIRFEELVDAYKEQMAVLEKAGADLLVVETMMSLQETRAALIAAAEAVELPVIVTMSFGEDGKTLYGTDAKTAAVVLEGLGAAAVGVNCSAGPDKMLPVIASMRKVVSLPLIAKPNAGLPKLGTSGVTEYDMEAGEFAAHMEKLIESGATILGGCCGTSPEYIRGVKEMIQKKNPHPCAPLKGEHIYLTSERHCIEWTKDCRIGEIGTSEYGELNEEWEDDIYDTLYDTIDDYDEEVDVLCICVDGCQENREEIVRRVVKETTAYTSLPLIFSSADAAVIEVALRVCPGRSAVIVPDSLKEQIEPVVKRYGAHIIEK